MSGCVNRQSSRIRRDGCASNLDLVASAGAGAAVGVRPLRDENVVASGGSVGNGEGHARGVARFDRQLYRGLAVGCLQPQAVDLRLVGVGEGESVGEAVLAGMQFVEELLARLRVTPDVGDLRVDRLRHVDRRHVGGGVLKAVPRRNNHVQLVLRGIKGRVCRVEAAGNGVPDVEPAEAQMVATLQTVGDIGAQAMDDKSDELLLQRGLDRFRKFLDDGIFSKRLVVLHMCGILAAVQKLAFGRRTQDEPQFAFFVRLYRFLVVLAHNQGLPFP